MLTEFGVILNPGRFEVAVLEIATILRLLSTDTVERYRLAISD